MRQILLLGTALFTIKFTDAEPPPVSLRPPVHDPPLPPVKPKSGISTEMKFSIKPFTFKTSFDLSKDTFSSKPPSSYAPLPPPYYDNPGITDPGGYSYNPPPTSGGGYSYKPHVSSGYSYKPSYGGYTSPSYGGYSYADPLTSGYTYTDPVNPSYFQSSTYQPYSVSYESRNKGYSSYSSYPQASSYQYDPWKPVFKPNYGEKYLHSGKRKSEFPYKLILVNKHNPEESHEIHLPSTAASEPDDQIYYVVSKGWRNKLISPYGIPKQNSAQDYFPYGGNRGNPYGHSDSGYGSAY